MYKTLLKYYLKQGSPAQAFRIATETLSALQRVPFVRAIVRIRYKNRIQPGEKREIFGLEFRNPVGLAASIDTEGRFYNILSDFGFSFVEIGPLSYVEQDYNTPAKHYLGVKKAIEHLRRSKPDCIIAGNISRSPQSHGPDIVRDYEQAFALLYDFVDMVVINPDCSAEKQMISSGDSKPEENENGISELSDVIDKLMTMRLYYDSNKPVLVRITPEITHSQTDEIIECCLTSGIDGVVAGSTKWDDFSDGNGKFAKSLDLIRYIREKSRSLLPIIGVGGVVNSNLAKAMLDAGASLLEVSTGFFLEGPSIVKNIVNNLPEISDSGNNYK